MVDVMRYKGKHVIGVGDIMINMRRYYPELYNHIFDNNVLEFTALRIFLKKNNMMHLTTPETIWQYINDNEDLHEWWML